MFSRYQNPKGRPKVCTMYESQHRIAAKSFDLYQNQSNSFTFYLSVKVGLEF